MPAVLRRGARKSPPGSYEIFRRRSAIAHALLHLAVRRCTVIGRAVFANRHSMPKRSPSMEARSSTSSTLRVVL